MTNLDLLFIGLRNLWRRKLRTFLTVLGVVIGAASIIIMISFGLAISQSNENMLSRMGDMTTLTIHSSDMGGFFPMSGQDTSPQTNEEKFLNDRAVAEIEQVMHVRAVAPVIESGGMLMYKKMTGYAQVKGIDPQYWEDFGLVATEGANPVPGQKASALIGGWVSDSFWDPNQSSGMPQTLDLIGQDLTWYGSDMIETNTQPSPFEEEQQTQQLKPPEKKITVVGTLASENFEYGSALILPFKEVQEMKKLKNDYDTKIASQNPDFQGPENRRDKNDFTSILVKVDDVDNVEAVQQEIEGMGYMVSGMIDITNELGNFTRIIQLVLGGIGAISLIVAAIGITNTMVMSIHERTREIGVMKVIGASVQNIRNMFLFEAGMIGLMGGAIGVLISLLASYIINTVGAQFQQNMLGPEAVAEKMSVMPLWLIVSALLFSIGIGVISGYYPAVRATRLSALEAMRND